MAERGTTYTIGFATLVCLVCGVLVAGSVVGLKELQDENMRIDREKNILIAAGLIKVGDSISGAEITARFTKDIDTIVIDRTSGAEVGISYTDFLEEKPVFDEAEVNDAKVKLLPQRYPVYRVIEGDQVVMIVLAVEGKGLWSTMKGYLSLANDCRTIRGVSFYSHGETPGLGGEIDNASWQAQWVDKLAVDELGQPVFEVTRGRARTENQVDGLSGATLTSKGVTSMVRFWLSESGYKPYLDLIRSKKVM